LLIDWDDPGERIAELERQQADANAAAGQPPSRGVTGGPMSTAGGELTADDVRNVVLSTPSRGKRGYDKGEVDAFLRRLEEHLRNPQAVGGLTAVELDSLAFSKPAIGKRGYDPDEVDAFLERAVQQLKPDMGSRPGFAAAHGGFRGNSGTRSKPRRYEWAFLPLAILVTAFSLVAFGIGVYDVHGYRVGTPTTAKVVSCVGGRRTASVACTGTWSVGGKSYAGRIEGDGKGYQVGSPLDVRVLGDTAYTATSGNMWFIIGTWAGVFAVGGFFVFFFARRGPTDAAPTGGRHSRR
jgi:DivIVA domain-containing protein